MARRRSLGEVAHDARKVNRMAHTFGKTLRVTVKITRSPTGHFHAFACAAHSGKSVKAENCGQFTGALTPTKAAAKALVTLGQALERKSIRPRR